MGRKKKVVDEPTAKDIKKMERQAKKIEKKWQEDLDEIRKGLFVKDEYEDD